jgi:hypothetical protein
VHDDLGEIPFVQQEMVAYPQQVFLALLRERNPWPNPSMGKIEISTAKVWPQSIEEMTVAFRKYPSEGICERSLRCRTHSCGWRKSIRHQRVQTTTLLPIIEDRMVFEETSRIDIVISFETHYLVCVA